MRLSEKKGQMWETMIPWIIAITVLVVISVFAYLLRDQLSVLGGRIHNAFR